MSGRPSSQAGVIGSDKTEKISLQCTPAQKLKLMRVAKSHGLLSSAMVRKWIDEAELR